MFGKGSEEMGSSELGQPEDVVKALLEYLVDPLLPVKYNGSEVPLLDQQQSVAKQVHAVVLLYNYYQRKLHAEVEFIGFESFCKLAVALKPTLMGHMKLMHQSDYDVLDNLKDQLSITEKAILNACNISLALDASKDAPSTDGWPVSKVAVLLTDSSKDNCLLQFSSVTRGVWSIIEKELDISTISSEGIVEGKHTNKRKRSSRKPSKDEANADEAGFRQLALSAVKEATGISQSGLDVLESHVVYSLSNEKTAACFYIMHCTQSIDENLQVPIKNVIESLQGPLVRKSYCWTVTSVVEYFHVLPYAGILTDWFSRKAFSNTLQDSKLGLENVDVNSSQRIDNLCDKEVIEDRDDSNKNSDAAESFGNEASGTANESVKQGGDIGSGMISCSDLENVDVKSSQRIDNLCDKEVIEDRDDSSKGSNVAEHFGNEASGTANESSKQRDDNGSGMIYLSGLENVDVKNSQRIDNLSDKEVIEDRDDSIKNTDAGESFGNEASGTANESLKQQEDNGSGLIGFSDSYDGPQNMDIDYSSMVSRQNDNRSKSSCNIIKVYHHKKRMVSSADSNINAKTSGMKVDVINSTKNACISKFKDEKVNNVTKTCSVITSDHDELLTGDHALFPIRLSSEYLEKLRVTLALKENALSQACLRALLRKRYKLSRQLRNLEDEIAVCEKNIQAILDGGEGGLALKIEAIIDACNDIYLKGETKSQERTCQQFEDQGSPQYMSKSLSEAVLTFRNSCQDLDAICDQNYWVLPTYHVSPADGGFKANVNVKGMDFECSGGSDLCPSPRLARESAAAQMIAKLRNMAGQSQ